MSADPVVSVDGVSFCYRNSGHGLPALDDVGFSVARDDFLGLIGPNGGGKTTLLKILLGALEPDKGTVRVLGRPPREVSRRIGYVPQVAHIDPQVPATVRDVVLTGRLGLSPWGFRFTRDHRKAAARAMEEAGVAALADRAMGELSGGQRQRVLIARALASDAEILLLDEPMAGVDLHMEQGIIATLKNLNRSMPIVLVSHDLGFVSDHVTRIACLNRSMVVHRPDEVTESVIEEMYREFGPVHRVEHRHDCPASERAEEPR